MKVDPKCKYEHGSLERPPEDSGVAWAIRAIYKETATNGGQIIEESPFAYTMHLYRCKQCGYIEFFDDEIFDSEA